MREKSDFQNCHIILFSMSGFPQKSSRYAKIKRKQKSIARRQGEKVNNK